jgi:hypothetical protein
MPLLEPDRIRRDNEEREMMSKSLALFTAAALALPLSGFAAAADRDEDSQRQLTLQVADPAAGGATASQREWEYLTALQKCELREDTEKTKCFDAARKKYGQM